MNAKLNFPLFTVHINQCACVYMHTHHYNAATQISAGLCLFLS